MNWLFLAFLSISLPALAWAQNAGPLSNATNDPSVNEARPSVRAIRLTPDEAIAVDGRLDEAGWQRAIPAANFTQQDPNFGENPTEKTEVRFLFSGNSLYMGVTCYDSEPDKLLGNTMQRDAFLSADDRFMWTFDPYLDGRTGYFFEMNPSGAMGDSLLSNAEDNNNTARAWDGIWYAKVNKSDIGWTIEIEIPFRTLNFDPNAPAWGANFQRTVRRKNEESLWTGWGRNQGLRSMTNAGLLEGISGVSQGIGLNIQPYVTGKYVDATGRNLGSNYDKDAGVDLTYSITPQLKANFTVNTDFAETEVDQRLVNLTRFPLFFPERRGFFLEGSTFFDYAREQGNTIMPFFSRRIGLDVNGHPQRIDYGAKITGQVGSTDIGMLQVRTAGSDTLTGEDFTVLRGKQRFLAQSYAGVMYTRRAGRNTADPNRHTAGVDFQLATSRFRGSNNMNLSGFYAATTGVGPVADRALYGLRFEYPNDLWFGRMSYREVRPNYEPAVGFVDRKNFRRYNPELVFSPRPANSRIVRRYNFSVDYEFFTDLKNRLVTRVLNTRVFHVEFQSGDSFQVRILPTHEALERDFEISRGVMLPGGTQYDFTRYLLQAGTANRRVVSVSTTYENGGFYSGDRRVFSLNLGIRPRRGVLINLNNEWNRVELPEGKFSTSLLRLNANTQFSPWISLVNNVQYDSVSRILGWQSRFRWIVRPGSDIYLVYAQNWIDDLSAGRRTLDRSAAVKALYTHRF